LLRSLLLGPGSIALEETDIPEPGEGELLIKVHTALTCGTDLKAYLRGHPLIPMPGPFGHEFSGTAAKRGKGVRGIFKEGDDIMGVHTAPCLKCGYCKKGLFNLCEEIMRTKAMGAFSEYILLPKNIVKQNIFHKPRRLGFDVAALLEPVSCVVHGIEPFDIKKGNTALVVGAGPIGLIHAILLKGKKAVTAVTDINRERLRKAGQFGAGAYRAEHLGKAVKEITKGLGFDYVFECTGRPRVWETSANHLRRGGTLVLFGGCPKGATVTYDTQRLHYDEITLRGAFHYTPSDVRKAFEILSKEGRKFQGLISGTYRLKDIEKAFRRLSAGKGIKYAIMP
jgi:L-iditol 2-dehydrogenase